jgi:hypothetical protein
MFVLPRVDADHPWRVLLDSTEPRGESSWSGGGSTPFPLRARSVAVLG